MNIFQQVFANANQKKPPFTNIPLSQQPPMVQTQSSTKPKIELNYDLISSRPATKSSTNQVTTVNFDIKNVGTSQSQKRDLIQSIIDKKPLSITSSSANNYTKKKKETHVDSSLKSKLEAIQKKVSNMELRLKQKEQDLRNMKEKNERLRSQKLEKEIYIEKMNAASDEINKKIIQMQDDFDQEDEEKNKYWEFRYMELKFQLESMKEEENAQ